MHRRLCFMSSTNRSNVLARSIRFCSNRSIYCHRVINEFELGIFSRVPQQVPISLTKRLSGSRCRTFSHKVNVSSNLIFKMGKFVSLKTRHRSTVVSLASMVFCTAVNKFSTSLSFRFSCDWWKRKTKSFRCHMMNAPISYATGIVPQILAESMSFHQSQTDDDQRHACKSHQYLQNEMKMGFLVELRLDDE